VWRAAAKEAGQELYRYVFDKSRGIDEMLVPVPAITLIAGGSMSRNAFPLKGIELVPVGAKSVDEAIRLVLRAKAKLVRRLEDASVYWSTAPNGGIELFGVVDVLDMLDIVNDAIAATGNDSAEKLRVSISADARQCFVAPTQQDIETETNMSGTYNMGYKMRNANSTHTLDTAQLSELYRRAVSEKSVVVIEDPFEVEALERFGELTEELGQNVQILANEIMRTSRPLPIIHRAAKEMSFNGACLRLDCMSTITEVIEIARHVRKKGWGLAMRTGLRDTSDSFASDLAVGCGCRQVRFGGLEHSGIMEKYSRLLEISRDASDDTAYAGERFSVS